MSKQKTVKELEVDFTKHCEEEAEQKKETSEIKIILRAIRNDIQNLNNIEIKNGGGRIISFKRSEFFQMLYDRDKERFNNLYTFSFKAMAIIGFISAVIVLIKSV